MAIFLCNKDNPSFDDPAFGLSKRLIFSGLVIALLLTGKRFVCCQVKANETYLVAKHQFSDRDRDVLMNVQSHHKWWSTLNSEVFCMNLYLPLLVAGAGGLVCESIGKADLSDNF